MKKSLTALAIAGILVASASAPASVGGPNSEKGCPGYGPPGHYWAGFWILQIFLPEGLIPGHEVRSRCFDN